MARGIERVDEALYQERPDPDRPLSEPIGQSKHRRAYDFVGHRRTVTDQMVLKQPPVELRHIEGRDPVAFVLSETGRHAVHRIVASQHTLHLQPTLSHALDCRLGDRDGLAVARDADHLVKGEALAVDLHRHRANSYRAIELSASTARA